MNLLRTYIRELISESETLTYKGTEDFFRVDLPGIGYAEGHRGLSLKSCQSNVDELMQTPEYLAAEEKWAKNAKPRRRWQPRWRSNG